MTLGGIFFNFIGATVRWTYGTIWRTLAKKKKYSFSEYLHGPKNGDLIIDGVGHGCNNVAIGMTFLIIVITLLLKYG